MGSDIKSHVIAIWRRATRRKHLSVHDTDTPLRRCLTTPRLTMLAIGNTVGVGIYVLVGVATKEYAGPGVLVSFLLAGLVTLLNALSFTEFAARIPRTGGTYIFAYEANGEAVAFVIGWIGLLGWIMSGAIAARAWSGYFDSIFDEAIKNFTIHHLGQWHVGQPFAEYPDVFAVVVLIFAVVVTSIGVNISSVINAILAAVSVSILLLVTVSGFVYGTTDNWRNKDHGGFFPFGFKGVIAGTSACLYATTGFDIVAFSAEEAKDPQKSVPRAIVIEIFIVSLLYFGTACGFTMLVPYMDINTRSPLPAAFDERGIIWAKYIVSVGPTLALTNLLLLNMYSVSRLCYSMAVDDLLFGCFGYVTQKTQVPVFSVLFCGFAMSVTAVIMDFKDLVGFTVLIGIVIYILINCWVINYRYGKPRKALVERENVSTRTDEDTPVENSNGACANEIDVNKCSSNELQNTDTGDTTENSTVRELNKIDSHSEGTFSTFITSVGVKVPLLVILVCTVFFSVQLIYAYGDIVTLQVQGVFNVSVTIGIVIVTSLLIWCNRERPDQNGFKVPLMPFLPVTSIVVNVMLVVSLADHASIIIAVIAVCAGVVVYLIIIVKDIFIGKHREASIRQLGDDEQSLLTSEAVQESEDEF